jgi:hypothetical protein
MRRVRCLGAGPPDCSRQSWSRSSTVPTLSGHLKYPNNLDQSLTDVVTDKIRKYRPDYNNRSPSVVSFRTPIPSTSDWVHSEFVRLLFLQAHRETDRFLTALGVQSAQSTSGQFHFRRTAFQGSAVQGKSWSDSR